MSEGIETPCSDFGPEVETYSCREIDVLEIKYPTSRHECDDIHEPARRDDIALGILTTMEFKASHASELIKAFKTQPDSRLMFEKLKKLPKLFSRESLATMRLFEALPH